MEFLWQYPKDFFLRNSFASSFQQDIALPTYPYVRVLRDSARPNLPLLEEFWRLPYGP